VRRDRRRDRDTLADALAFGSVAAFTADWGYESQRDGERWHAELCEDCAAQVRRLIDSGPGQGVQLQWVS